MKMKFVTFTQAVNKITADDGFIKDLAAELMLEELLVGECSPTDYLVESLENVLRNRMIRYYEGNLSRLLKRNIKD